MGFPDRKTTPEVLFVLVAADLLLAAVRSEEDHLGSLRAQTTFLQDRTQPGPAPSGIADGPHESLRSSVSGALEVAV